MRVSQQPAFVLHRRDYGESSLLLELFSRDFGRVGVIAKGARRSRKSTPALLSPFQPLLVGWAGKGELATLTGAETEAPAFALAGTTLWCGFYINELMLRLLHRYDAHETLFAVYQTALLELHQGIHYEATLRIFEKRLLQSLGYGLVLEREAERQTPIVPESLYTYMLDQGPVPNLHVSETGVCVRGASLLALSREQLTDAVSLHEAKLLLRAILAQHLGDQPLHTRRLFREVHAAGERPLETSKCPS